MTNSTAGSETMLDPDSIARSRDHDGDRLLDLLGAGRALLGPVLQVGGCLNASAVSQQLLEIGLEFGQVRRVAAEMAATQTGELVGASLAASLDIRRLGADAEGHGNLADPHPGVGVGENPLDAVEYAAALSVELVGTDTVRKALADMHNDGSDITVAATAARAGVHRSFIHRDTDLHATVLNTAAEAIDRPSSVSTAISHRSHLPRT